MKILALNSSPRIKGQSKTELMLSHLAAGMEKAGAQVEVVHLRTKNIKNCVGCLTCWTKSPGRCIHRDDMSEELFPRFVESDIVVFATPLYHYTMNAAMKAFMCVISRVIKNWRASLVPGSSQKLIRRS